MSVIPPRPVPLPVIAENIPIELKSQPTWVLWKYTLNKKGDKWDKVPFQPNGAKASTTNPTTWLTFDSALAHYQRGKFDGIGIVLRNGIAGVDLDHVVKADGTLLDWAQGVVKRFEGTYVERSPGADGLRIFCRGVVAKSGKGEKVKTLEVYDKTSPRFLTVTGHRLSTASDVIEAQAALDWVDEIYKPGKRTNDTGKPPADAVTFDGVGMTDDEIIDRASKAKNGPKFLGLFGGDGGSDSSSNDLALCDLLAFWTRDPAQIDRLFRRSGLMREKWDSKRRDSTYGADTITEALMTVTEFYSRSATKREASLDDFHAYMPDHRYIYIPTGDLWPGSSVDARCPWPKNSKGEDVPPRRWLDQNRAVEQMTWAPGEPQLIENRVVQGGGWIQKPGVTVFNLYKPPTLILGDSRRASPWREHVRAIYPDDADHIEKWFAQRVQRPDVKLNHALLLGGAQGIGKDTLCEPVKHAIGPWNFGEISPAQMLGRFNGWTKNVIVRVSEARDLGEVNRFAFYEHSKVYIAAPPDVLRVDEKNCREYPIINATGLLITTNYKCDGIYLPPDDRRHYVAWSDVTREAFDDAYWRAFWCWLANGGTADVAAFLRGLDLSDFDPKAPPPKTEAFYAIVQANANPEESELADLIDHIGHPAALTLEVLAESSHATTEFKLQLSDMKMRRTWPHRMEQVGYVRVQNAAAPTDGLWKVKGRRQAVYARRELKVSDRLRHALKLVSTGVVWSV